MEDTLKSTITELVKKYMINFIFNLLSFNNRMIADLSFHYLKIRKQVRSHLRFISFTMKNPKNCVDNEITDKSYGTTFMKIGSNSYWYKSFFKGLDYENSHYSYW